MKNVFLPQFFQKRWSIEYGLYNIEFTKDICIGIVERVGGGYSYLPEDEFNKLGLSKKELLDFAISNLKSEFEDCELKFYKLKNGKLGMWYSENDNFTAVRVLIPEYRDLIINKISTNFKFTIPSRDIITCWISSSYEENSKFEKEAKEDFEDEEYNLSSKVYTWGEILFNKK